MQYKMQIMLFIFSFGRFIIQEVGALLAKSGNFAVFLSRSEKKPQRFFKILPTSKKFVLEKL